jgi:hypothetical protein
MTNSSGKFGSASSLSSLSSAGGSSSHKKKKPAPAPPRVQDLFPETLAAPSDNSSEASSPCPSLVGWQHFYMYRQTLVSADSVFAVSVICGLPWHKKIWKIKEINGS